MIKKMNININLYQISSIWQYMGWIYSNNPVCRLKSLLLYSCSTYSLLYKSLLLNLPLSRTTFHYSKISNHTCNRRLRYSTWAEAKVILLLHCCCIPSRPAVKLQNQRATSFISPSSMFYSLALLIVLLSRTWSMYL